MSVTEAPDNLHGSIHALIEKYERGATDESRKPSVRTVLAVVVADLEKTIQDHDNPSDKGEPQ